MHDYLTNMIQNVPKHAALWNNIRITLKFVNNFGDLENNNNKNL